MNNLTSENGDFALVAKDLVKEFKTYDDKIMILKGLNFEVKHGEDVGILGASGVGKSTLLHILGTLEKPTRGELRIRGRSVLSMNEEGLSEFRRENIGFIFQFHFLLSELNAVENVTLPLRLVGVPKKAAMDRASQLLEDLGLGHRLKHFPTSLSGGERQRVALARALIQEPKILLADEPTGNLDSVTSRHIQDLLLEWKQRLGFALVVVTHDHEFARRFSRVVKIRDGEISETDGQF